MKYYIIIVLLLLVYCIFSTKACNRNKQMYEQAINDRDTTYIDTSNSFIVTEFDTVYQDTGNVVFKPIPITQIVYKDTGSTDTVYIPLFLNTYKKSIEDSLVAINVTAKVYGSLDSLFVDYKTHIPVIKQPIFEEVAVDGVFIGPEVIYNESLLYGLGAGYISKSGWDFNAGWYPENQKSIWRFGIKKKIW